MPILGVRGRSGPRRRHSYEMGLSPCGRAIPALLEGKPSNAHCLGPGPGRRVAPLMRVRIAKNVPPAMDPGTAGANAGHRGNTTGESPVHDPHGDKTMAHLSQSTRSRLSATGGRLGRRRSNGAKRRSSGWDARPGPGGTNGATWGTNRQGFHLGTVLVRLDCGSGRMGLPMGAGRTGMGTTTVREPG